MEPVAVPEWAIRPSRWASCKTCRIGSWKRSRSGGVRARRYLVLLDQIRYLVQRDTVENCEDRCCARGKRTYHKYRRNT